MPDTFPGSPGWPYLDTLTRLALALGLGLFVGLERELRGKKAGVRTFAFVATVGCVGGLLGDVYCYVILGLLAPFIVFINIYSLRKDADTEMTTSVALLLTMLIGILCGKGHTFTPVALGLMTAGLLAWKQQFSGFSIGITENELRSAILLGILIFVYQALTSNSVDPRGLIEPRAVWITITLIAAIGLGNYVLLKWFGSRMDAIAGFLGGLVNSTGAIAELSNQTKDDPYLANSVLRHTMLATSAMLLRNVVLLVILSPTVLFVAGVPMAAMLVASLVLALTSSPGPPGATPTFNFDSPFSLLQALKIGVVFFILSIFAKVSVRALGSVGFYAVSTIGGFFSSAAAVASAGQLAAHHHLTDTACGIGSVFASIAGAIIGVPIVSRCGQNRELSRRFGASIALVALIGIGCSMGANPTSDWLRSVIMR